MLGPIGKIAKAALTRAGYRLTRPTIFEGTLTRSAWEDWFSADPERLARIYKENRELLEGIDCWAEPADLENSLWRYGVMPMWDGQAAELDGTALNQIEKEVTYSDLIAFVGEAIGHPVCYLEIGVSVGKNFLQMCRQFNDGQVVGLDIEDINPTLRRKFTSERMIWRSEKEYEVTVLGGREAKIRASHHELTGDGMAPVVYVKGDQFNDETWASLKGRQFNLIFSDGVHRAHAVVKELDFLIKHDLIPSAGPFVMIWDDLINQSMQEAFVSNAGRLQKRFGASSWYGMYRIHGTYGPKRYNGIFSTLRL